MLSLLPVSARRDIEAVRELFAAYARAVDEPCCFAGFERELATLPGEYAPPTGRLLLARAGDAAAGCVGLRRLDTATAEMKRLYVRPASRGLGLGRALAEAAIAAAREAGYSRLVLDRLPKMREAAALYGSLRFRPIPPYLEQPTPGALCFELTLQP